MQGTQTIVADPGGSHAAPWFCVWTKPAMERLALRELQNQKYPAWLPLWADRSRISPMFPRYLFAQPLGDKWGSMRHTRGVTDVIRDPAGRPRIVSGQIIATLQARCREDGAIHPEPPPPLAKGQSARILTGPLTEFVGLCAHDAGTRVKMLFMMFGQEKEFWFAREQLEAL